MKMSKSMELEQVKEIFDFGIILDLGAASGFIHISEISWDQVDNLTEKYKIGDTIDIVGNIEINSFNGKDLIQIRLIDIRKA